MRGLPHFHVAQSSSNPRHRHYLCKKLHYFSMKEPSASLLLGRLQQSMKHVRSIRKAADDVNIPYSTAWRMLHKHELHGGTKPRRVGSLSASDDMAAYNLLGEHTATTVSAQLYQDGTTPRLLHKATVIRAARRHAALLKTPLRFKRGPPKKELSDRTKTKRLSFAHANMKTNWKMVLFTDRKKFAFKYPGVKVGCGRWLKGSEECTAQQVNHSATINIYAGLSPYGMTLAHEVAGTTGLKTLFMSKKGQPSRNISSQEYSVVMNDTLLPEGKRLFSQGGGGIFLDLPTGQ